MDYRTIALAVCNGDYTHTNIALAIGALEVLGAPQRVIDEMDAFLYEMRESTADES